MGQKHTISDLYQMQSMPLSIKVRMTQSRIRGCHLEKPGEGRFLKMKETHPKQYDYIMRPTEQGGLGYKEIIDWINEHGGFNIELN